MFTNKSFSKSILLSVILGLSQLTVVHAMDYDNNKNTSVKKPTVKITFNENAVIQHAATAPLNYDMNYLQSPQGIAKIKKYITGYNNGTLYNKLYSEGFIRSNADSDYNKSTIARIITQKRIQKGLFIYPIGGGDNPDDLDFS